MGQRQEEGDEEIVNRFLGDYFSLINNQNSIYTYTPSPSIETFSKTDKQGFPFLKIFLMLLQKSLLRLQKMCSFAFNFGAEVL